MKMGPLVGSLMNYFHEHEFNLGSTKRQRAQTSKVPVGAIICIIYYQT
jgi:hypothetical protein